MRFKHRHQVSQVPEISLTPMLNVMMGILAFFVMVTMMLTTEQGVQVQLPSNPETVTPPQDRPEPLVVQLTVQGIVISNQPTTREQLVQYMQDYLANQPQGVVVLQAEPDVPYEQVVQWLGDMKDVGGDRVSLAID